MKDPSDNSVRMFMRYAWMLLPEKFTPPQGKTITVDKSKPKEVEVPMEVAREAVKVGYYSAHAQLCNLWEEQQANYQTLMARQRDAKWTDQQRLYIQKLHQATVMIMTGKISFQESEGNLKPVQRDAKTNITEPCSDAKRQAVKAQIANYINAAPKAKTAVEPAKADTAEPAKADTAEPAKADTAEPAKADTAEPAKADTAEPAKANTAEPAKANTAEPAKAKTAEPAKAKTAEPAKGKAKTAEPAKGKAKTAEPAKASTQKK